MDPVPEPGDRPGRGEGPHGMRVNLRSGRGFRSINLNNGDGAEVLLRFPFERWTVLHGYEAILDPEQQCIIAAVTVRGTILSKIPGAVIGPPEEAEPVSDQVAGRRVAFRLPGPSPGPSSLTITGPGGPEVELRSRAPAEIKALHGSSSRVGHALIIRGVTAASHDAACGLMEELSAAVSIELDRDYGLAGTVNRSLGGDEVKAGYDEDPISTSEPQLPSARCGRDAAALYLYARSVPYQLPTLEYLAYYQVIEFYMAALSRAATIARVSTMLRDTGSNPDDELAIDRLIDTVLPGGRAQVRERDQVAAAVDEPAVARFPDERPAAAKALRNRAWITGVWPLIPGESQPGLVRQVAERIYGLRCRIVHSKDSFAEAEPLHPFGPEAQRLHHDLHLIRFVSQHVLIASSKPASWS